MKEFKSLQQFSNFINKAEKQYPKYEAATAHIIGEALVEKAKEKIGYLQPQHGEFTAWQPLTDSTKADKERQGYVFKDDYNPLYRTGELKESIHHFYNKTLNQILLGSASQILYWQDQGTVKMVARSVIGATMYQSRMWVEPILMNMLFKWITQEKILPKTKKVIEAEIGD